MKIEPRAKTTKKYVVRSFRIDGTLQKRYIGQASDPAVQLFLERELLTKASEAAYREACRGEQDNDIAATKSLDWLCRWSAHWKVTQQLYEKEMSNKPRSATVSDQTIPRLHKFNETSRRAAEGEESAQQQLDVWIAATPEILNEATEMIAVAREYLIRQVGSASAENAHLWQMRIDSEISAILEGVVDDPLSRMFAEVAVLAKLDVMRSSLMPYLAGGDQKRSSYWGAAMSRSQQRWVKISTAFLQHMKLSKKLRSRK